MLAALTLVGAAARRAWDGSANDDTYFHLRFGSEFLTGNWSLWSPGSPTEAGTREWVPTQWATQMLMASVERAGGIAGVAWLAALAFVSYAVVLYCASRRHAPPLAAAVASIMAFLASSAGLSARPQVISYILTAVVASAWLSAADDRRVRWWVIPATWIWSCLHGMWVVGLTISAAGAVGIILEQRSRSSLRHLLVPALSLVAVLLNPLGPSIVSEAFTVGSRGEYFLEWGPTNFKSAPAVVLGLLLGGTIVSFARQRAVRWSRVLLLLLAGAWAVYAIRCVPAAAAISAPLAAEALAAWIPPAEVRRDRLLVSLAGVLALAATTLAVPHTATHDRPYAAWADAHLSSMPSGTRLLNEWAWGGYLMWRHPELDVLVSGYADVYQDAELARNHLVTSLGSGWLDSVTDLAPDFALLDPASSLAYSLEHTAGWKIIREDNGAVLLAPDSPLVDSSDR